jgi:hypothetical protein
MARERTAWIMGVGLAVAAPLLLGNSETGGFEARVLAAHNRERAALGVAPLAWDAALAGDARAWADRLAATGTFAHAPVNPRAPQGENLWAGTRARFSVEAMVDGWAREKRRFKPGAFPDTSITGRWQDVGHYTQLIWRDTRHVGCAVARGAEEDVLVCRYARAGNWVGERPY